LRYLKPALSILSHGVLGVVVFFIANFAAQVYFSSLLDPIQNCPGIDKPLTVNANGDQVRMKAQTCGSIPRVKSVLLYIRTAAGKKRGPFLSYTPDGADAHVVWAAQNRVSVDLPSAHAVGDIRGRIDDTVIDYHIERVLP
jgi:hypothetical protein